jgi:hypothetical protein
VLPGVFPAPVFPPEGFLHGLVLQVVPLPPLVPPELVFLDPVLGGVLDAPAIVRVWVVVLPATSVTAAVIVPAERRRVHEPRPGRQLEPPELEPALVMPAHPPARPPRPPSASWAR